MIWFGVIIDMPGVTYVSYRGEKYVVSRDKGKVVECTDSMHCSPNDRAIQILLHVVLISKRSPSCPHFCFLRR